MWVTFRDGLVSADAPWGLKGSKEQKQEKSDLLVSLGHGSSGRQGPDHHVLRWVPDPRVGGQRNDIQPIPEALKITP